VSGPKGKDVEPTVKGRKRSTADNWPPRAEPGAGQGAFERTEGLCQTMPNIGAMRHVPERARTRRVVRLVSVTADTDLSIELKPGMSVFIPPFVRHEITATGDEPMEGIIVLYGDNSDFAFGTSYPSFLEDLNEFYADYPFRNSDDNE